MQQSMVSQPVSQCPPSTPCNASRRLGQMLIDRGKLTTSQLELALLEHRRDGQRLGQVLCRRAVMSVPAVIKTALRPKGV